MNGWRDLVDEGLDASLVGYTRLGPLLRRRVRRWSPLPRLDDRVVAVTGATSGLGRATARGAAALGAHVVLVVRDEVRGRRLAAELRVDHGREVELEVADLAERDQVLALGQRLAARPRLDGLVHQAGALLASPTWTSSGDEVTTAVHVLAPYALTCLARPALERAGDARVVVTTSGGMYTQPLDVDALVHDPHYVGSVAYARAKRAQVSLVDLHRDAWRHDGVVLVAYHPGWADTEGLARALPRFRRALRPLLRRPEEGADTALWLLGAPRDELTDTLYCDRRARPLHRLHRTRRSDSAASRHALDELVRARCGLGAVA